MKAVKIYGNDGDTIYTDLDVTENKDKEDKHIYNVVYLTYGVTPKEEIMKHLEDNHFMICNYHSEGYNTEFQYIQVAIINRHLHGSEIIEFTNNWTDGTVHHISYDVASNNWTVS